MLKRVAAFTLIEILVTIAIFAILVTLTGYVYASALSRSRDHQRISDLQSISNGLEQYYLDHKAYPSYGANRNNLFLAKFQLERFADCTITSIGHEFMVPTYMSSIPEDPNNKFVLNGSLNSCDAVPNQAGQYLYIPHFPTGSDPTGLPVKDFQLAAKVERLSNVSPTLPNFGYYRPAIDGANGINFCSVDNITNPLSSVCSHNFYLGPKKNQ